MWDSIVAARKGFKGLGMHELRGSALHKKVLSIDEYLRCFKESRVKTGYTIVLDGWIDVNNHTILFFLSFASREQCF